MQKLCSRSLSLGVCLPLVAHYILLSRASAHAKQKLARLQCSRGDFAGQPAAKHARSAVAATQLVIRGSHSSRAHRNRTHLTATCETRTFAYTLTPSQTPSAPAPVHQCVVCVCPIQSRAQSTAAALTCCLPVCVCVLADADARELPMRCECVCVYACAHSARNTTQTVGKSTQAHQFRAGF